MDTIGFPSDKFEALAMLYVQKKDTSDLSPEQLFKLYQDALQAIRCYAAQNRSADWMRD